MRRVIVEVINNRKHRRIEVIAEVHTNRPNRRLVPRAQPDRMRKIIEVASPDDPRNIRASLTLSG